ncbi:hypothetical protein NB311A_20286 [Nitrobacter sp. Nb-311A]|nr:hypothetical protein NB311A_20286 [Nitrobacter sp. Nb-311A]
MDRNDFTFLFRRDVVVAPLAGAWIETSTQWQRAFQSVVAPLAGAWIETQPRISECERTQVAPLAGAWIETLVSLAEYLDDKVAPLAGAWIETNATRRAVDGARRRAPRGRVDRNVVTLDLAWIWSGRAPRGRVDRNFAGEG